MGKIFKYISVFFLWLAVLTLSAHQIIPHDHHLTDPFSKQDNNCPFSNNKSGQKSGLPVHCHAFNELVSDKSRPIQISQKIQYSLLTYSILTDTSAIKYQSSDISLIDFSRPSFDLYVLESSLLRAPPSLA